ncbi:hypothetical protein JW933_10465 [candidate division FCPU426 bacterium]|nr:hypothetical protein [candidate division FCPU426 bacterium]
MPGIFSGAFLFSLRSFGAVEKVISYIPGFYAKIDLGFLPDIIGVQMGIEKYAITIGKLAPTGTQTAGDIFLPRWGGNACTNRRDCARPPKWLRPWTFLFRCHLGKKISPAALTGWIIRKKKDASGGIRIISTAMI